MIDASNEDCQLHKLNVCLGRSANHVIQKNEANRKIELVLSAKGERIVIWKVRRDILLIEQLHFDYGDKVAQAVFDHSS